MTQDESLTVARIAAHMQERIDELHNAALGWQRKANEYAEQRNVECDRADRAEARIAELEAALAERDARPVPANPYTVVVSELSAITAPDACPHAEGTREWARWMAKERGVCVQHYEGQPIQYLDEGFHVWNFDGWREASCVDSINSDELSTGWRIVDNPEAGQ
jgi:hypothetical protein